MNLSVYGVNANKLLNDKTAMYLNLYIYKCILELYFTLGIMVATVNGWQNKTKVQKFSLSNSYIQHAFKMILYSTSFWYSVEGV